MLSLGKQITDARKSRGLTQEQLGAKTGYVQSIISRKEKGALELTPCDAANLARALIWPALITQYCRNCPATKAYKSMQEAG